MDLILEALFYFVTTQGLFGLGYGLFNLGFLG